MKHELSPELRQQIIAEFWPEIERTLQAYRDHATSKVTMSYSVIEIPQMELGKAILEAVDLQPKPMSVEASALIAPGLTEVERWRIFLRDDFTCQNCRNRTSLTVDHKIPRCNGGTNDEDNLQTLCRSCNSKKGTK